VHQNRLIAPRPLCELRDLVPLPLASLGRGWQSFLIVITPRRDCQLEMACPVADILEHATTATRFPMEYRQLGRSGFKVPVLSLGTGTFAGRGEFFNAWGATDVKEATRLVDICLEAGLTMFDSADGYSAGGAEEVLGAAIKGRRDQVLISTKAGFPTGEGANEVGSSRFHLTRAVDASLKRLGTDHIDLFQIHTFDAVTPPEETLGVLDDLVRAGKILYLGVSNFSGWHLMKALAVAEKYGLPRYVANQTYYSLVGRDYEWELMPLGLDQGVGAVVWSPLGWGRLTGKIRRGAPLPQTSRLHKTAEIGPPVADEYLYKVVDALDEVAKETGKTVAQIALNWLLQRPTVSTVVIGARNEQQLRDNLGAVGWNLTKEQMAKLDAASAVTPSYPYWHQRTFGMRNPPPV
jgi:aryl-alcohol dehydrogenase-like predicted oxidoreductase